MRSDFGFLCHMVRWLALLFLMFTTTLVAQVPEQDSLLASNTTYSIPDSLVALATSLIGIPYQYGGESTKGFDCSGLVRYVYGKFGKDLPHSSAALADVGIEVPLSETRKGDIILFSGSNKKKRPIGHAGIVVSDLTEPLSFIHSAYSQKMGVILTAYDAYDYYKTRFVKVIRVLDPLYPSK